MPDLYEAYVPLAAIALVSAVVLAAAHFVLLARHDGLGSEARLPRQLFMLVLTVSALILMVIVAPLPESTRNQVLSLLGVLISAVLAFSSTSFVTNFMAALMLRVTRPFKVGDFITVDGCFGKVTERGLFDTEIQTEHRELIAIPNATFITKPVTVSRNSGVIVSTTLSLGYDLGYNDLQPLMVEAAEAAGLSDPFVLVIELGDFAVTYRVSGLLQDVDSLLTARSKLNVSLMHVLHGSGIEIVSPTVTRHITHDESHRILPDARPGNPQPTEETGVTAEEVVFDKARDLAAMEQERELLKSRLADSAKLSPESVNYFKQQLDDVEMQIKELRESD
jgi:small-conductance mechanosensitive channel